VLNGSAGDAPGEGVVSSISARRAILELAQAASLATALCYGAGWTFIACMYSRLGVQPEDVGVGAEFVLVRAAVVTAGLLLVVGGLMMPTAYFDWLARGRHGDLSAFHLLLIGSHLVLFVASVLTAHNLLAAYAWSPDSWTWVTSVVAALTVTGLATVLFLQAVDYRALSPRGPSLGPATGSRYLIAAAFVWVLLAFVFAAAGGIAVGDRIADGHSTHIVILNVRWVEASNVVHDDEAVCGLRLGENGGFVRIYVPSKEAVVALPTDQTTMTEPLNGDC
jgi:hypothetical protein